MRRALLACLLACAVPATAQAAPGTTSLQLGAKLRDAGIGASAVAPAKRAGGTFRFPATARTAAPAAVTQRGGLRLHRRGRALTLSSLRVGLGALPVLTARAGGERRTIATVRLRRSDTVDRAADRVRIAGAHVVLTRAGGALLRDRLGLRERPTGRIATLVVQAAPGPAGGGGGGGGPSPAPPGGDPLPPPGGEPAPLPRPASAVDITSAQVTWHVRESFIRYIATGEGTSVHDGATAGEPVLADGSDIPLVYDFGFPFAAGWYDPASGAAAVHFTGRVRFSYSGHGIQLDAADPELELAASGSRAVLRIDGRREVLVDLHPGAPAVAGATRTYTQVPGTIPASTGAGVFAGFYLAGDPFGWFTVTFTT